MPSTRHSASAARMRASAAGAICAVHDDLGQHRVVVRSDLRARFHPGFDARAGRPRDQRETSRARLKFLARDLPHTDAPGSNTRAAGSRSVSSGGISPAACRTIHSTRSMPVTSSVTPCSTCRRVFTSRKYQSRGVVVVDELHRAGRLVVHGASQAARAASNSALRAVVRKAGRGRLLDHLLIAALRRAIALAQRHHLSARHRRRSAPRCGARARRTFPGRGRCCRSWHGSSARTASNAAAQFRLVAAQPHADAAAARRALQHHRIADRAAPRPQRLVHARRATPCRAAAARRPARRWRAPCASVRTRASAPASGR